MQAGGLKLAHQQCQASPAPRRSGSSCCALLRAVEQTSSRPRQPRLPCKRTAERKPPRLCTAARARPSQIILVWQPTLLAVSSTLATSSRSTSSESRTSSMMSIKASANDCGAGRGVGGRGQRPFTLLQTKNRAAGLHCYGRHRRVCWVQPGCWRRTCGSCGTTMLRLRVLMRTPLRQQRARASFSSSGMQALCSEEAGVQAAVAAGGGGGRCCPLRPDSGSAAQDSSTHASWGFSSFWLHPGSGKSTGQRRHGPINKSRHL